MQRQWRAGVLEEPPSETAAWLELVWLCPRLTAGVFGWFSHNRLSSPGRLVLQHSSRQRKLAVILSAFLQRGKAEGRQPIVVYLPYLAGTADERQYRVMSDRERWFRVVMGQDEVAKLITPESSSAIALPEAISNELSFKLGLDAATS